MKSLLLVAALIVSPIAMAEEGHGEHGMEPAAAEGAQHTEKVDKKSACEQEATAAGKKGSKEYKKAWKQCMHAKK